MTLILCPPFAGFIPEDLPAEIGAPYGGGFFAGLYTLSGVRYALVLSPKAQGERAGLNYNAGITTEGHDGRIPTEASPDTVGTVNQFTRNLVIGGFDDWYTPGRNELEMLYRAFKPGAEANWTGARVPNDWAIGETSHAMGQNDSSDHGGGYTTASPAQTPLAKFQAGGSECMAAAYHWSSTANASFILVQSMTSGGVQSYSARSSTWHTRAVRKVAL